MIESTLYLNFFRKYKFVILIPVILALILSTAYETRKSPSYEFQAVYEYQYTHQTVSEDSILAEQLVGILREKYPSPQDTNLLFFRSAPLTIHFTALSQSKSLAEKSFNAISPTIVKDYPLNVVIEKREYQSSNFSILEIVASVITTLCTVIFLSSLFEYFKKY